MPSFPRRTAVDVTDPSDRRNADDGNKAGWESELRRRERQRDTALHLAVTMLAVLLLTLLAAAL